MNTPLMRTLNYHHLLYFWTVARSGGVTAASERLHVSQPTVSAQLKAFQRSVGQPLFRRVGRSLELTETGRLVLGYADEIFALGDELVHVLGGRPAGHPVRLAVGLADVVPKLVAFELLRPADEGEHLVRLVCHEGTARDLLVRLAAHQLDVVLSDSPASPDVGVRAFSHLLGECGAAFFAAAELAAEARGNFPRVLAEQPLLLPGPGSMLRRNLDLWLDRQGIRPIVAGEFADTALLNVFGQAGRGIFAAPDVIAESLMRQHHVELVGRVPEVHVQFYAISPERRVKHPAVLAITAAARRRLFAREPGG